ncbi:hypothetical protein BDY21DRAFT_100123 [Lineolata rhizophorae]|uniref:Uncharacterized protein n=1 Tax=Lineolata rhizophorae TaxID=578093 RepID=A0A6A6NSB8_9PEZI|nr:hypothetical protein BDY21DRAFT_100123 [Lineolata rhizophorae]
MSIAHLSIFQTRFSSPPPIQLKAVAAKAASYERNGCSFGVDRKLRPNVKSINASIPTFNGSNEARISSCVRKAFIQQCRQLQVMTRVYALDQYRSTIRSGPRRVANSGARGVFLCHWKFGSVRVRQRTLRREDPHRIPCPEIFSHCAKEKRRAHRHDLDSANGKSRTAKRRVERKRAKGVYPGVTVLGRPDPAFDDTPVQGAKSVCRRRGTPWTITSEPWTEGRDVEACHSLHSREACCLSFVSLHTEWRCARR